MQVSAIYHGQEIEVWFTAYTETTDYGVPGSPVWEEIDPSTIRVDALSIMGVDVEVTPAMHAALRGLADELTFD